MSPAQTTGVEMMRRSRGAAPRKSFLTLPFRLAEKMGNSPFYYFDLFFIFLEKHMGSVAKWLKEVLSGN